MKKPMANELARATADLTDEQRKKVFSALGVESIDDENAKETANIWLFGNCLMSALAFTAGAGLAAADEKGGSVAFLCGWAGLTLLIYLSLRNRW